MLNDIEADLVVSKLCTDFERSLFLIKQVCDAFDIQLIVMTQPKDFADLKEFYTMTASKEYAALSCFLMWHMKLLLIS
jgi:spore maturation protein CgeB